MLSNNHLPKAIQNNADLLAEDNTTSFAQNPRPNFASETSRSPNPDLSNLQILVIDDNADNAESLAMLLRMHAWNVDIAHDGTEALARTAQSPPDVVLLDICMPGINGFEVAKQIYQKPTFKRPLLIGMTGYELDFGEKQAYDAGFDLFLIKPIDPAKLLTVIDRFYNLTTTSVDE